MFIDYISLMLGNAVAGFCILAYFVVRGLGRGSWAPWAPAFGAVGLVAFGTGLHMTLTWPIPQLEQVNLMFANVAFGEATLLFGAFFLAMAWAAACNWTLEGMGIFSAISGLFVVIIGLRIGNLGITQSPQLTMLGFVISGLGGIVFAVVVCWLRQNMPARIVLAVILLCAAAIWAFVGAGAYWGHLQKFSQVPSVQASGEAD